MTGIFGTTGSTIPGTSTTGSTVHLLERQGQLTVALPGTRY